MAVDPQGHLVRVVGAHVGPASEEPADVRSRTGDDAPVERDTGVTVALCTYLKCELSGPFSATICGCTASFSVRRENSG